MTPRDPSQACLVLGGEVSDRDRFTLQDLLETKISNTFLAYLSACSAAENSAKNLVDEVLHLASGFQLAGFPHVVGSIWEACTSVVYSMKESRSLGDVVKGTLRFLFTRRSCRARRNILAIHLLRHLSFILTLNFGFRCTGSMSASYSDFCGIRSCRPAAPSVRVFKDFVIGNVVLSTVKVI